MCVLHAFLQLASCVTRVYVCVVLIQATEVAYMVVHGASHSAGIPLVLWHLVCVLLQELYNIYIGMHLPALR
jgi:hypothetical protein